MRLVSQSKILADRSGQTPFMNFWAGLNGHLRGNGFPELDYGAAKAVWERAQCMAEAEVMRKIARTA